MASRKAVSWMAIEAYPQLLMVAAVGVAGCYQLHRWMSSPNAQSNVDGTRKEGIPEDPGRASLGEKYHNHALRRFAKKYGGDAGIFSSLNKIMSRPVHV
uniref:Uncharacterized protein n=1 Tax=Tetraselmis sp. GSL018 TaxID=582737 RepID=A0A061SCB8_9CHLO